MSLKLATKCVYTDGICDAQTGATNPPIYQSAAFEYSDPSKLEQIFSGREFGHVYSRISNPTISELERRITYLESALGTVAVSSGLSAIFLTCLVLAQKNSNIVVSNSLFGGSRDLFEETISKLGLDVRFVDVSDSSNLVGVVDNKTSAIFAEIISNPKLVVPNVIELSDIAKQFSIPLIIDATLTSSVGFNAKDHGVDVVIYSSTKLFSSNTGSVGGLIVDTGNYDWRFSKNNDIRESSKKVHKFGFLERVRRHGLNNAGFNTSPMNAYFTMIGLETLHLRYQRICENALAIAKFFESQSVPVNYPGLSKHFQYKLSKEMLNGGFGPLLTIDLGSKPSVFKFISALKIAKNMSNLGDNRTMVIHPASTIYLKHSKQKLEESGVTDGLVRINVGIEDLSDLMEEFQEALAIC